MIVCLLFVVVCCFQLHVIVSIIITLHSLAIILFEPFFLQPERCPLQIAQYIKKLGPLFLTYATGPAIA